MARATTLSLVASLSNGQADAAACDQYYTECLLEQAMSPAFATSRVIPVTALNPTVTYPTDVIEVFSVLYDARPLTLMPLLQLEARNPHWRDQVGAPLAYTHELETVDTFRLYPKPPEPSGPQSFVFGEPMGRDFPVGSVTLICTTTADLPSWFDLPLALKVLSKEYGRESNHRDPKHAEACLALYRLAALLAIGEP